MSRFTPIKVRTRDQHAGFFGPTGFVVLGTPLIHVYVRSIEVYSSSPNGLISVIIPAIYQRREQGTDLIEPLADMLEMGFGV